MKRLERPQPVFESVRDAIRAHIMDEGLKPGDPLESEGKIAERLGVSRITVREAVKALTSLGILESQKGRGVYVSAFSFEALIDNLPFGLLTDLEQLSEILEIRCVLEVSLIVKVVEAASDEHLAALREVLASMRVAAELGESIAEADRAFHQQLFACHDNKTLLRLLDVFWMTFNRASGVANITSPRPIKTYADHAAIVEAVEARDAERAAQALRVHYVDITELLRTAKRSLGARA